MNPDHLEIIAVSQSINTAARRHDRAVGNVWACVAVATPPVLAECYALDVALDQRAFGGVVLLVAMLVVTVAIVGNAYGQAMSAGQTYRLTRDAGFLRIYRTWSR